MLQRRRLLQIAALGGAWLGTSRVLAQSPVRVLRKNVVIVRREFDRKRPPADMPTLTPPESGVCNTQFELEMGVGSSIETVSPTALKMFVDELDLTTGLTLTIFTLKGSPQKLRDHEEGHRAISEYYYKNAAAIAEAAGKSLIGKEFAGNGANRAAAEQDAFTKINAALEDAYMARTRFRALAANGRFDEVTQHGLNALAEADAVAMAVAADPER
jgi:hypothetical protein